MITTVGILTAAFWVSAALHLYVYWGYGALLDAVVRWRRDAAPLPIDPSGTALPSVTVLLTVHNEERAIERRLANLLAQDYPAGRLDIVVASDGSTDRTEALVTEFARGRPVRLVATERLGKSGAQNVAMQKAGGEIVVLTDAEASFDVSCIRELVAAFADRSVGCATAHLQLADRPGAVARSQGYYWSYELGLRMQESRLGILAVASGQAMAFRRSLFRELPAFVGDDCAIPLDVVDQGYRVVHCCSAVANDAMVSEDGAELRARARMTARNWTGTWLHPWLLNPARHPGYAFALWSHKLLRWLGSAGLVVMTLAAAGLAMLQAQRFTVALLVAFWAMAGLGFWGVRRGKSVPIAGTVYSFVLANAGFLLGLGNALRGRRTVLYGSAQPTTLTTRSGRCP